MEPGTDRLEQPPKCGRISHKPICRKCGKSRYNAQKSYPNWTKYKCPGCGNVHMEARQGNAIQSTRSRLAGYVYFILAPTVSLIKIGKADCVEARLLGLQTASPCRLELLHSIYANECCHEVEKSYHRKFRHLHSHGEWFRAEPELLDFIRSIQEDG